MARSEKSKNRAPVDPFETFFHPEQVQGANASAEDVVSINPTHQLEQTLPATDEANGHPARPTPQLINPITGPANEKTLYINTATEKQFEDIHGIGPVLAQRIIAARPFKSADNLREVKGIGSARYQKLRAFFE